MKFTLYFIEDRSYKDRDAVRHTEAYDGWFENEYEIPFEADDIESAKLKAHEMCDSSSGVFNVYGEDGELLFTEENL